MNEMRDRMCGHVVMGFGKGLRLMTNALEVYIQGCG